MENKSPILITGIAGFIGFHLAKELSKSRHIIGIDNLNDYYDSRLKTDRLNELGIDLNKNQHTSTKYQIDFKKVDLNDTEVLNSIISQHKIKIVIHLAAQAGVRYSFENPKSYIDSNILGFYSILEVCKINSIKKLVYASSSSVYGNTLNTFLKESQRSEQPESIYAATKKCNEILAYTYSKNFGLETIGLRFFTVYGPFGRPDMSYFKFLDKYYRGEKIQIYNHGAMLRDFTYIDDIIEGIIKTVIKEPKNNKSKSRIYNIGCGNPINLLEFIEELENISEISFEKEFVEFQKGDVKSTHADLTLFKTDYPSFEIKTQINLGLKKFVKWYKNYKSV